MSSQEPEFTGTVSAEDIKAFKEHLRVVEARLRTAKDITDELTPGADAEYDLGVLSKEAEDIQDELAEVRRITNARLSTGDEEMWDD